MCLIYSVCVLLLPSFRHFERSREIAEDQSFALFSAIHLASAISRQARNDEKFFTNLKGIILFYYL